LERLATTSFSATLFHVINRLPAPYPTLYIVGWTKDKLERIEENRMPKLIFSQELEGVETKRKTQAEMERRGRKRSSSARSEEMERAGDR
jgi:hypothetical protein